MRGKRGSYETTDSPEGGWLPKGGSAGQIGGDEASVSSTATNPMKLEPLGKTSISLLTVLSEGIGFCPGITSFTWASQLPMSP